MGALGGVPFVIPDGLRVDEAFVDTIVLQPQGPGIGAITWPTPAGHYVRVTSINLGFGTDIGAGDRLLDVAYIDPNNIVLGDVRAPLRVPDTNTCQAFFSVDIGASWSQGAGFGDFFQVIPLPSFLQPPGSLMSIEVVPFVGTVYSPSPRMSVEFYPWGPSTPEQAAVRRTVLT